MTPELILLVILASGTPGVPEVPLVLHVEDQNKLPASVLDDPLDKNHWDYYFTLLPEIYRAEGPIVRVTRLSDIVTVG